MKVSLRVRTEEDVAVYFEKAKDAEVQRFLPMMAQTLNDAISDYRKTLESASNSYGRTVYADDKYVGDIWCYGIHEDVNPDAMISYCIFEKQYWNRGIATEALKLFLNDIVRRFALKKVGAFTYSANIGSIKVLERNGFQMDEAFVEDGVESKYYLLRL